MLLPLLAHRTGQILDFRRLEPDLIFNDLTQRHVGSPQAAGVRHQRPAQGAGPGIELADAAGNQVDQKVGIAHFLQCLFC